MENKIVVPEGMFEAGYKAACLVTNKSANSAVTMAVIEAALSHLKENPMVPTEVQGEQIYAGACAFSDRYGKYKVTAAGYVQFICEEWQRRMFLAPEPEVPKEIADLMISVEGVAAAGPAQSIAAAVKELNAKTIEAYRRGRNSK